MTYYSDRMDELRGPAKVPRPRNGARIVKQPVAELTPSSEVPCVLCGEVAKYNINGFRVCASERHKYLAWSFDK